MKQVPVLIAGGGPVGMTLACELSRRGIACLLVERNPATTRHPKMDITNARSMELFRRLGVVDALRAVAVPESSNFDVSWITSLTGHELHRFRYPSVTDWRRLIADRNDGTMPCEPPMRVSQVEIEPVLQRAVQGAPMVESRWGVELEDVAQDEEGVTATLRTADGAAEQVRCRYLAGCDGGTSRVRQRLGIRLEGQSRVQQRFLTHFRSTDAELLQRWGIAWHYQSAAGTLIAQNDKDIWTLQTRWPDETPPDDVDIAGLLRGFAGRDFSHEILVANAWTPHFVVAERYIEGRVLLAGDAAHQYVPTGGYGMNTGIGDACDLGWKLAAVLHGTGGARLLASYERERRPVGLRNCDAARQLYRVTAGLESMIVGEAEVQGQVKRAFELAQTAGATGPLVNRLFGAALQTGKRVRTETAIGEGGASVSSVAVDLARDLLGDLAERRVVIIGAGEMAELTARALHEQGVAPVFFANRRADRARAIAAHFGGDVVALEDLPEHLEDADIVVSSTSSPHASQ